MKFEFYAEAFFYELERTANVEKFVHRATRKELMLLVDAFEFFRIPTPLQLTLRMSDLKDLEHREAQVRNNEKPGSPRGEVRKEPERNEKGKAKSDFVKSSLRSNYYWDFYMR